MSEKEKIGNILPRLDFTTSNDNAICGLAFYLCAVLLSSSWLRSSFVIGSPTCDRSRIHTVGAAYLMTDDPWSIQEPLLVVDRIQVTTS